MKYYKSATTQYLCDWRYNAERARIYTQYVRRLDPATRHLDTINNMYVFSANKVAILLYY